MKLNTHEIKDPIQLNTQFDSKWTPSLPGNNGQPVLEFFLNLESTHWQKESSNKKEYKEDFWEADIRLRRGCFFCLKGLSHSVQGHKL